MVCCGCTKGRQAEQVALKSERDNEKQEKWIHLEQLVHRNKYLPNSRSKLEKGIGGERAYDAGRTQIGVDKLYGGEKGFCSLTGTLLIPVIR